MKSNIPIYFLWLLPYQGELSGDSSFLSFLGARLTAEKEAQALCRYIWFYRQQNNKARWGYSTIPTYDLEVQQLHQEVK
jgi:hypothetical protein